MSDEDEVIFEKRGAVGHILLNRPKALNALTLNMVMAMTDRLQQWAVDHEIGVIVIEGAGEKGFCAGGDIRALYDSGRAGTDYWYDFYSNEYRLDTLIQEFPKPYVAIINGITMGGGVGVSVNGAYRIASDRTLFAMPETGIGLIPDVGGSYFLPRLKGYAGIYLGLTGARLRGPDCRNVGVATHYVPEPDLSALVDDLTRVDAAGDLHDQVRAALDERERLDSECPYGEIAADVDRMFAGESLQAIMAALETDDCEFAGRMLKALSQKSPTSLLVTFEQLKRGRGLTFRDAMVQELRCVMKIRKGHDFFEGVRAVIVDKDNAPLWEPALIDEVSPGDVMAHFDHLNSLELAFL